MSQREKRRRPTIEDAATMISSLSTKIQVLTDVQVVRKKKLIITAHTFLKQRQRQPDWGNKHFCWILAESASGTTRTIEKKSSLIRRQRWFRCYLRGNPPCGRSPQLFVAKVGCTRNFERPSRGPQGQKGACEDIAEHGDGTSLCSVCCAKLGQ